MLSFKKLRYILTYLHSHRSYDQVTLTFTKYQTHMEYLSFHNSRINPLLATTWTRSMAFCVMHRNPLPVLTNQ